MTRQCPLTRKPLTVEEVNDLAVNVFIKNSVANYKKAEPWWDDA